MRTVPIDAQLTDVSSDPLRILVIGAGIAGTAFAQLLRQQGLHPVLIERAAPDADSGYMLGLLPLADPVLDRLGVRDEYEAHSVRVGHYVIRGHRGRPIRTYDLDEIFGPQRVYRGISRAALLTVLAANGCPLTYRATVAAVAQDDSQAQVSVRVDSEPQHCVDADFDLVVAADGMHSSTRGLILRDEQVSEFDTGVGGWVGWIEGGGQLRRFDELWGAGFFVGTYPVSGRTGVFVGGRRVEMAAGPQMFVTEIRRRLTRIPQQVSDALDAVERSGGYLWRMEDRRATSWRTGRVVLLGDAAVGFLPTAGIGAAMAIESAGVLATVLTGCRSEDVSQRLATFERIQRPRSEAAQRNSRQLAKLMFQRRPAICALRDLATHLVPARAAMGPIRDLLDQRPGSDS